MKQRPEKVHNKDRDRAIAILHERVVALENIFDAMVKYIREYIDFKGDLVDFSKQQQENYEKRSMAKEKQEVETKVDNT